MNRYVIKKSTQLPEVTIKTILNSWDVEEWREMDTEVFRRTFENSEFHLLISSQSGILSLARLNFDFSIEVAGTKYEFAEFVGFVSVEARRGYGSQLLYSIIHNLYNRSIESVGFCEKELRPFYQKNKLQIFYDQAQYLRELDHSQWIVPTDNDILDLTLSDKHSELLKSLHNENLGYILS